MKVCIICSVLILNWYLYWLIFLRLKYRYPIGSEMKLWDSPTNLIIPLLRCFHGTGEKSRQSLKGTKTTLYSQVWKKCHPPLPWSDHKNQLKWPYGNRVLYLLCAASILLLNNSGSKKSSSCASHSGIQPLVLKCNWLSTRSRTPSYR